MANEDFKFIWKDRKHTFLGLPLSFTVYYLTETKLICQTGFLNIVEDEIDLYKITDKRLLLPFGQRMFGCGTIHVSSRDVNLPEMDITCIKKPRDLMNLLDQYVDKARDKYGTRGRDLYGTPPAPQHYRDDHDYDIDDDDE